jgi:hypothetical protein
MKMSVIQRFLISGALLASCALLSVAQVPRKKSGLTKADREAWREVLKWPDEYEERWRRTGEGSSRDDSGLTFYRLGRDKYLVEINIYPGWYQPGYIFMLYDESGPATKPSRLLRFKHYERDEDGRVSTYYDAEMLGFFTFDDRRKTLEVFSKSRGPGDCGSVVRYKFVGRRSVPVEARAQPCYNDPRRQTSDTSRWRRVKRL